MGSVIFLKKRYRYNRLLIATIMLSLLFSCTQIKQRKQISEINKIYKSGYPDSAYAILLIFIKDNPANDAAWVLKGNIEKFRNNDSIAFSDYKRALQITDKNDAAYVGLGVIYRKRNNLTIAENMYINALKINPKNAQAYSSLAVLEMEKGLYQKSVSYGMQAYMLNGSDLDIAANLAIAYHHINDTLNRNFFYKMCIDKKYKHIDVLTYLFEYK